MHSNVREPTIHCIGNKHRVLFCSNQLHGISGWIWRTLTYTQQHRAQCTSHMFTASVLPASKSTESGFSLQAAVIAPRSRSPRLANVSHRTLYLEIIYMHFPQSVPRHCHLYSTGYHFKYWENHAHANGYHLVNVCLYIHRVRFTLSVMHIWTYHPLIHTHTWGGQSPVSPVFKESRQSRNIFCQLYDTCYTYHFGITSDRFT